MTTMEVRPASRPTGALNLSRRPAFLVIRNGQPWAWVGKRRISESDWSAAIESGYASDLSAMALESDTVSALDIKVRSAWDWFAQAIDDGDHLRGDDE